jgi:hypothetical protein
MHTGFMVIMKSTKLWKREGEVKEYRGGQECVQRTLHASMEL